MSDLLASIPTVFYDLVCRVVPGGLLIFLYRPDWFWKSGSGPSLVIAAVASWALGMTIDVSTAALANFVKEKDSRFVAEKLPKSIHLIQNTGQRDSLIRAYADRAFFRCTGVVCALTAILSRCCNSAAPEIVSGHEVGMLLLAALFFWCWYHRLEGLKHEVGMVKWPETEN